MPFDFRHEDLCPQCPYGTCVEDRRINRVRGRNTQFRLKQNSALSCTFGEFVPGTDSDPDPTRTFTTYLNQFQSNARRAGMLLFGDAFRLEGPALGKVEGDVFELMVAAALWNAATVWNEFMDTGKWTSSLLRQPEGAVAAPTHKVAIFKLPRGYDATKLFKEDVRASIRAHEASLKLRGMELGLSAPDIVGVRIPHPVPEEYQRFLTPLQVLDDGTRSLLERVHLKIEGTLDARSFLMAIAVKRSTRSDRLYQPLFEANILKYLIQHVLRGAAFRFHVHMGSFEGADVVTHYKAASLVSLLVGGQPTLAVDRLLRIETPVQSAQAVLDDLPLFPG